MLRYCPSRLLRSLVTLMCVHLLSETNADSCEGHCGEKVTCSCHPTRERLPDCGGVKQFCADLSPHSGSLLGGADFRILNSALDMNVNLTCRFKSDTVTRGYVDTGGVGHCVSPMLFETGWIPFDVSTDGVTYSMAGSWLSVHHSKLAEEFKVSLVNETKWQYYGTQDVGGALEMVWNASLINAKRVNVELWGYQETGMPYSDTWQADWRYLYSVGRDVPNSGSFRFVPELLQTPRSDWDVGSIRVCPSTEPDGARNVNALWSGAHALAYNLDEAFRKDPAAWALEKCLRWDQEEKRIASFLSEITDCPCTLAQARADTGRFHTDYGCDIEKGSVCTYHPGAVHCVRAIQASPEYGAGQQCCYDHTGAQVLTGDSIGGSTPDRGHDWGAPPYRSPPRVPGFSHWKYDVITFYYCCLWSDNCDYYFNHRPSSDCRTYKPPKSASVLGDPHFLTFDGVTYTFNGKGEYLLLHSLTHELTVQGRTEPMTSENGSVIMATRLSSVAMRENGSDVIEVRLSDRPTHLQVLLNQKVLSFSEQSWMDLKGAFVFSSDPQNVTVMFPSGAGVEVRGRAEVMTLTVLLPQEFKHHTQGLLGNMNDDPDDDLTSRDGEVTFANSTAQDIFTYGARWAITNEISLFTYDSEFLLNEYYFAPKHDPTFIPNFSVGKDPSDPLLEPVLKMCSGVGASICKYDALSTRSLEMGNMTLLSLRSHAASVQDLRPVLSCGWLQPPKHGQKEGTLYLEGAKVIFSCKQGYHLYGSQERICQGDGHWSGDKTYCLSDDSLAIALGTIGAILAVVAMVTSIVVYSKNQKREGMKETEDQVISEPNVANL
ncbi:sushi domain-containing protein 2 isoform X1 [Electrophorus electricus]|uniref:sushi domain-containing protein 2 isoform X1 n=1 Tax=Electrophorus electricus TaxID=8005 RepID=UPI0015D0C35D|nr:sushi domain-containing protein 2 isoform X1 [Electrophorus electricus]